MSISQFLQAFGGKIIRIAQTYEATWDFVILTEVRMEGRITFSMQGNIAEYNVDFTLPRGYCKVYYDLKRRRLIKVEYEGVLKPKMQERVERYFGGKIG